MREVGRPGAAGYNVYGVYRERLWVPPGTITNPGPRRSVPVLVYLRALLYLPEIVWACLGAIWASADSQGCDPATVGAVIAAVVARYAHSRLVAAESFPPTIIQPFFSF